MRGEGVFMYQALYRKYRPRCFSDVTGQEHITDTLRRQIINGRISHAYLFVGTRGTGKTTCAKILSRAINCAAPVDGDPCNICASCKGIESGSILDVLELEAASNNRVDDVRALLDEAIYTPASVTKRVYIVDEVHMLTPAAFNALLQILEEPPEHLLFILATTELHKVPATILSRCQRFSFKRLPPALIAARLNFVAEKEGLTLTSEAAMKLSALADGSMRDGLSLLDQCVSDTAIDLQHVLDTIGLTGQKELLRIAGAISDRNIPAALEALEGLYSAGRDMASLLNETASLMRDLLVYKLSDDSPLLSGGFERSELSQLSNQFAPERLFYFLDVIRDAAFSLTRGGSAKLTVEMCLIRLCDESLSDDGPALLARILRLEAQESGHGGQGTRGRANGTDSAGGRGDVEAAVLPVELPLPVCDGEPVKQDASSKDDIRDVSEDLAVQGDEPERQDTAPVGSASDADASAGFWNAVLEYLRGEPPIYFSLNNNDEVSAELRDNVLILSAKSAFTVNQIESKQFSDAIKDAAKKVLGHEIIIRTAMDDSSADESKHDKLERLADTFSIVNFEKGD